MKTTDLADSLKISKKNWLREFSKLTHMQTERTMYNWWKAFCRDTHRTITPGQATAEDRDEFFTWLKEAADRHAAVQAEKRAAREAQRQHHALEALYTSLQRAAAAYGHDRVIEVVIERFLAHHDVRYFLSHHRHAQEER